MIIKSVIYNLHCGLVLEIIRKKTHQFSTIEMAHKIMKFIILLHRNAVEDFISLLVNILRYDFIGGSDRNFDRIEVGSQLWKKNKEIKNI